MRTALVTGANRGIGAAVATSLESLGMRVLRGSRSGGAGFVQLDVTSPLPLDLDALDVLINNAGISGPLPQTPGSASLATVRSVFETNFFGVLAVTQAMLPLLRRSPSARIVNVTSGLGSLTRMSDPSDYFASLPPSAAYAPSKTALNALTVQMAKELRPLGNPGQRRRPRPVRHRLHPPPGPGHPPDGAGRGAGDRATGHAGG